MDFTPNTRVAANVEYLSSYIYKLVFNDNYTQAVSSEVLAPWASRTITMGSFPPATLDRLQTFASSNARR